MSAAGPCLDRPLMSAHCHPCTVRVLAQQHPLSWPSIPQPTQLHVVLSSPRRATEQLRPGGSLPRSAQMWAAGSNGWRSCDSTHVNDMASQKMQSIARAVMHCMLVSGSLCLRASASAVHCNPTAHTSPNRTIINTTSLPWNSGEFRLDFRTHISSTHALT